MTMNRPRRPRSPAQESAPAANHAVFDIKHFARTVHDYYCSADGMVEMAMRRAAEDARNRIAVTLSGVMDHRRANRLSELDDLSDMEERIEAALAEVLGPEHDPLANRILVEAEKLRAAGNLRRSWAQIIAGRVNCTARYVRNVLRKAEL